MDIDKEIEIDGMRLRIMELDAAIERSKLSIKKKHKEIAAATADIERVSVERDNLKKHLEDIERD